MQDVWQKIFTPSRIYYQEENNMSKYDNNSIFDVLHHLVQFFSSWRCIAWFRQGGGSSSSLSKQKARWSRKQLVESSRVTSRSSSLKAVKSSLSKAVDHSSSKAVRSSKRQTDFESSTAVRIVNRRIAESLTAVRIVADIRLQLPTTKSVNQRHLRQWHDQCHCHFVIPELE